MDFGLLIALGSLLVAAIAVFLNVRKAFQDRKLARRVDLERELKAPAERDSIIVSTANEVVKTLRLTLADTRLENKQLRDQIEIQGKLITEQDKRIRALEYELARVTLQQRERELHSEE